MTPSTDAAPRPPGGPGQGSKSLFSAHFMEHRLPDEPVWREDLSALFESLRALYESRRDVLPGSNEATTEHEFIRPALELLGFQYILQAALPTGGPVQRPDYALFADEAAKKEANPLLGDASTAAAFYARVIAIADAKYWGRPLSETRGADGRDELTHRNPGFQMADYLKATGLDWGILTNGCVWRLYYRQVSYLAGEFYEVNLVDLLAAGDLERFKYFGLFFRRAAFVKDARGRTFLERVREGSTTYARAVGDQLKAIVFDRVFPLLAGGFVSDRQGARGVDTETAEGRREIYQATLALLYKLLFLLYAEARNLLPVDQAGYRQQSLTHLAQDVAGRMDRRENLGERSTQLYAALLNLFDLVDQGDPGLGVPHYNGGLFSPTSPANRFLHTHKLADAALAPALDALARLDGRAIDYGFLQVQHLGAIYEGLLEYRLIVDEPAAGKVPVPPLTGLVHLETDKGERKATGSYYTPDYVVKYIVRHTVGPILDERAARFGELMVEIGKVRRALQTDAAGVPANRTTLARLERQARETLLDVKVCDPAMGSGHFLVEAVDFLADGLVHILNQYPEHNPVLSMLDDIRTAIVANLAAQGLAADAARLDDTQLLQRVVMKRCVYGVDLNPMAVELAKVGLWLHTFTVGAPLSFLDHHLRWGNSLIGASAREADVKLGQDLPMFGGPFAGLLRAAEIMRGIGGLSDATLAEVEQSGRLFGDFDAAARPYKQLLDIYVARDFGVPRADEFLRLEGADAVRAGPDTLSEAHQTVIRESRRLYEEKRFFHWDLEFPEVFIDLDRSAWKENPGFDAVVGNPPYDVLAEKERQEDLSELVAFISANSDLKPAIGRKLDLFRLFTAKFVHLARTEGFAGLIIPMSLLADQQTANLRRFLLTNCRLTRVDAFPQKDDPHRRVFREAKLPTCIAIIRDMPPNGEPFEVIVHPGNTLEEVGGHFRCSREDLEQLDAVEIPIPLVTSQAAMDLLRKISSRNRTNRMDDVCQTYQGEINETTMAALLSSDPGQGPQVLRGGNVLRYEFIPEPRQGVAKYIDVKCYRASTDKGRILHTQMERIGYQRNAALDNWRRLIFGPLPAPCYCFDSVSYFPIVDRIQALALLAILNSRLLEWRFRITSTNNHVSTAEIGALPIPWSEKTEPDERARLAAEAVRLAEVATAASPPLTLAAFVASELGAFVAARLAAEQADVVHDLLAHLAGRMIELNRQKQAEMKGFLAWLARETKADLDALTGKARLHGYLGDYQKYEPHLSADEALDILRRNRARLGADPTTRTFQEGLHREYAASLDRLLPLKARLAATDRLIDLIVYRLYGLTPEEVAVVEGTT